MSGEAGRGRVRKASLVVRLEVFGPHVRRGGRGRVRKASFVFRLFLGRCCAVRGNVSESVVCELARLRLASPRLARTHFTHVTHETKRCPGWCISRCTSGSPPNLRQHGSGVARPGLRHPWGGGCGCRKGHCIGAVSPNGGRTTAAATTPRMQCNILACTFCSSAGLVAASSGAAHQPRQAKTGKTFTFGMCANADACRPRPENH